MLRSALLVGGVGMLDALLLFAQTPDVDPITRQVSNVVSVGLSAWIVIYFITKLWPRWEARMDARDAAADKEREKFYADASAEREKQAAAHAAERAEATRIMNSLAQTVSALHNDLKAGAGCRHTGREIA